ncbi:nitrite reductase small subunit, partial [Frankia casuarinae]
MIWTDICALDDLTPDRGVAALVNGAQVAIFRLSDGPVLAV